MKSLEELIKKVGAHIMKYDGTNLKSGDIVFDNKAQLESLINEVISQKDKTVRISELIEEIAVSREEAQTALDAMDESIKHTKVGIKAQSRVDNFDSAETALQNAIDMLERNDDDDWDEKRIDIVGSNGNDGLHYEDEK